jgi:hypothetical protein
MSRMKLYICRESGDCHTCKNVQFPMAVPFGPLRIGPKNPFKSLNDSSRCELIGLHLFLARIKQMQSNVKKYNISMDKLTEMLSTT